MKQRILVHSCCAPCTTATVEKIVDDHPDDHLTIFYYNPNISPESEEIKRYEELCGYISERYGKDIDIVKGKYDHEHWNSLVGPLEKSGEGGLRCRICYYIRLLEAFKKAEELECTKLTTTLSISPYKNFEWLNEIGAVLSKKYGILWFLEKWDYKRSVELSKQYDLYRQNYCGCQFSKKERTAGRSR